MAVIYEEDETQEYESGFVVVGYGTGPSVEDAERQATYQSYSSRNDWWDQPFSDYTGYSLFAPEEASEDIADSLQDGDSFLVIHEYYGEEYWEYSFLTEGFAEASKPVFDSCKS